MSRQETYISIDIESDGPIPGVNSMRALGAAAYNSDGKMVSVFYDTMKPLLGAHPQLRTMEWWKKFPEQWQELEAATKYPGNVIQDFDVWLSQFENPIMVASPAGFDFTFVRYYLVYFLGTKHEESGIWRRCIDFRSYVMGKYGKSYFQSGKRNIKSRCKSSTPHTHNALDDAMEQGEIFMCALKDKVK